MVPHDGIDHHMSLWVSSGRSRGSFAEWHHRAQFSSIHDGPRGLVSKPPNKLGRVSLARTPLCGIESLRTPTSFPGIKVEGSSSISISGGAPSPASPRQRGVCTPPSSAVRCASRTSSRGDVQPGMEFINNHKVRLTVCSLDGMSNRHRCPPKRARGQRVWGGRQERRGVQERRHALLVL